MINVIWAYNGHIFWTETNLSTSHDVDSIDQHFPANHVILWIFVYEYYAKGNNYVYCVNIFHIGAIAIDDISRG